MKICENEGKGRVHSFLLSFSFSFFFFNDSKAFDSIDPAPLPHAFRTPDRQGIRSGSISIFSD